jgi:DNA-binding NarL/FixJ family response regulator
MKARLLLADDHSITLAGMKTLVEQEYELAGEVRDGRALITEALRLRPDLIIVDIGMPLLNGIEAAKQIRKAWPAARFLFVSMHASMLYVREAMSIGSSGYLLKSSAAEELLPAIKMVLRGQAFVTPVLAANMAQDQPQIGSAVSGLTARQREILQLVAEGRSSKEMAHILGISAKTAEYHRHQLMRRLGLRSVGQLAAFAVREGFVA